MKRYRLGVAALGGIVLVLVGLLVFGNLNRNLVYYLTPDEALSQRDEFTDGRRFQLGGLVQPGSVIRAGRELRFVVASETGPGSASVPVVHVGAPAQLFRAGIGVVLEGAWRGTEFVSDTMIVKHDETYAPPPPEAVAP
ncbi:MAG: cytochrome c maturation protein CcmE [Pseudonocardiaceae bacterium]